MNAIIKQAYREYIWMKLAACVGLVVCAFGLMAFTGGFPPWAWRFLAATIPQLSQLWRVQGPALLLPFIGLCLLSLSLVILWTTIVALIVRVLFNLWDDYRARQTLQAELRVAEILAERNLSAHEETQADRAAMAPLAPALARAQTTRRRVTIPIADLEQQTGRYQQPSSQERVAQEDFSTVPLRWAVGTTEAFPGRTFPAPQTNRQKLRLVPPIVPLQDEPSPDEEELEQEEWEQEDDLADAQFIGREDEPDVAISTTWDEHEKAAPANAAAPRQRSTYRTAPGINSGTAPQAAQQELSIRLAIGIGIDTGLARKDAPNEDSLFAMQGMRMTDAGTKPAGLFVVADGMGGHANGREASRSAIRVVSDTIVPTLLRDVSGSGSAREDETLFIDMLKDGVHRANLELYRRNREAAQMMGTTLTSVMVVNTTAYVANVGDSRTYLYRVGYGLRQITRDHSVVAQMVANGVITPDDVYTHPRRNQIYRCLGEHATVEVDTFVVPLQPDDVLLLCSDGLWEMVHDRDLAKIVGTSTHSPTQLSALLVQAALNYGGADNISVVVVHVTSASQDHGMA